MNPFFRRFIGFSLILIAIAGILLGPFGIFGVWRVRSYALIQFYETTELIQNTLSATTDGFDSLSSTLDTTTDTLDSTETVARLMAQFMTDMNSLNRGFMGLLNLGLPGTTAAGEDLETSNMNLELAKTELANMADKLSLVGDSIAEARVTVADYQHILKTAQERLTIFQIQGPVGITATAWLLTLGLTWFMFAQIPLVVQGLSLLTSPRRD